MLMTEKLPEPKVGSECKEGLLVQRKDISFHDLDRDRARVLVRVHNFGVQRSLSTMMTLQSAPLGAFVPWQPLAELVVPALEPGESQDLGVEVLRSHPVPLGNFDNVPPKKLLVAVDSPDQPLPPNQAPAWLNLFVRGRTARSARGDLAGRASLAPDLWELVGRSQPHWAGNINVFVGSHPVERHLAKALRVYPGRTNLAMFMVGASRRRDAFAFKLVGLSRHWEAALYNTTNMENLLVNHSDVAIEEAQWVESLGGLLVLLAAKPPPNCLSGNLEIHVTQRTTGKTAVVEFNLDPSAQGAGCYYL